MQKYAIPTLILALVSVSVYAFNLDTDPRILIEKENREKILKCLEDVYAQTGSTNMIRKIKFCESLPLLEIGTHSTGSTVPPQGQEAVEIAKKKFAHAKLYQDVCKKQINSPLCKDRELFDRLYQLTEERLPGKNFYPILIGMTNAESSLGLDYAKDNVGGTCNGRNNWGGAKYIIKDDNSRDYSRSLNGFLYGEEYSGRFVDQYGCNLFPFKSIEEYWISKVNGIRYGYAGCVDHERPIWCISGKYVGNAKVHEQSWIDNVSVFLN